MAVKICMQLLLISSNNDIPSEAFLSSDGFCPQYLSRITCADLRSILLAMQMCMIGVYGSFQIVQGNT